MYDQLLVEFRNEDRASFHNFMCMPPIMFDELLARVGPMITKVHTSCREPLEPGLKLAPTLNHLASGCKYASMKFEWRDPRNTQSLLVQEVCQAVIDEYIDDMMTCPTTPDGRRAIADLNFIHVVHLMGSTLPARVFQTVGPYITTTKDSTPLFLWRVLMHTTNSSWQMSVRVWDQHQMLTFTITVS